MRDYARMVEILRNCAKDSCETCPIGGAEYTAKDCRKAHIDAADAIEELLAEMVTIRNQLPKWISVKERLPEESGYTIIFCADGDRGHVTFGKFLKTPKLWELSGARSYWRVLWWMPLPAPPKGVE